MTVSIEVLVSVTVTGTQLASGLPEEPVSPGSPGATGVTVMYSVVVEVEEIVVVSSSAELSRGSAPVSVYILVNPC